MSKVIHCAPPTPDCACCVERFYDIRQADVVTSHVQRIGVRWEGGYYGSTHGVYSRGQYDLAQRSAAAAWEAIYACPCQQR